MEGRRQRYTPARLEERAAAAMAAAITDLEHCREVHIECRYGIPNECSTKNKNVR